ncbi:MAG: hypothetical protein E7614_07170 [Ruminococcaceae bacterium]|nr:hypothetical protein [Oscillospiraceae bacterium]
MFELTNEQRKCFALPPILDTWQRIEVKAGPYDKYVTYAFVDGRRIVKVIQVSETPEHEMYQEYGVDQMLSDDGTKILPKTDKGKPQNFTAPNLVKKTPVGMSLSYGRERVIVVNLTTQQCYYRSSYNFLSIKNLYDFSKWVDDWCFNTSEKELAEINEFSKRTRVHQMFQEGDFFRYRITRNLYGYGRILVDYAKMRKEGIPFWDVFFGKPLCVAAYHIVTEDAGVNIEYLARLKMLPSQMIMDNIFFYGECEIIGNMPISEKEDNYTIHYGQSIDARKPNYLCYQSGKTYVALKGEKELDLRSGDVLGDFSHKSIRWDLDIMLPILLECIKKKSNEPYWNMIPAWRANQDLRNPKFKKELKRIKKQMGVK